ncbi:MAG: ABC transporter ATP-binding protein [Myxococcales bacterium]|nr:ABC transporter ATP-binding protein [Myxococcales bacterium]
MVARGADFVDGSVLDNLRLMARDCGKEASVRALLRLTQLERVVDGLPQGLETRMTPAGAPLSSSQARRLALARALAARPRVLLLDGALDGLGLEEDERDALLDAVLGPGAPWTVVVVTEDPAVAARCDRVATLRDGELEVA